MRILKKNVIAMAVMAALAAPLAAQASEDAEVSGFIDVIANTDAEQVFFADAEIDISKKMGSVTVRVDADLTLASDGGSVGNDSGRIEQAYFAWAATETVTVLGGVFNNPIGQELEDAPDMDFTSHSAIWAILDNQTVLNGNNVAGIAGAAAFGPATVTLAVIDDIGFSTDKGDVNGENKKGHTSIAAVVNLSPMKGLDLELGYVTQNDQKNANGPTTAGNVIDLNGKFSTGALTVGLDYLTAQNVVDSAANLWLDFDINDKANVKVRYETVAYEAKGMKDATKTTIYGTYTINDNLSAALELSSGENKDGGLGGIADDDTTTLEFIGTF